MSRRERNEAPDEALLNRIFLFGIIVPVVFSLEVVCSTQLASIFLGHETPANENTKRLLLAVCFLGMFCHTVHLRSVFWFRITSRAAAILIGGYLLVWIIGFLFAHFHLLAG